VNPSLEKNEILNVVLIGIMKLSLESCFSPVLPIGILECWKIGILGTGMDKI
jgi:hypothetical protein